MKIDGDALLPRLQDDAQHVGRLLDAERGGRLVEDQDARAEVHRARNREGLALAARQSADQPIAVVDPRDPEFAHRPDRDFVGVACDRKS